MGTDGTSGAVNILVVDEDGEARDLIRKTLTREGHNVVTSSSGAEALEAGRRECFDMIVSDVTLGPELSGLDLVRAYKAIQPEAQIILIAAPAAREAAVEALTDGAFDYLAKPFSTEELRLRVGRALGNRHLIRENFDLKREWGSQVLLSSLVGCSPAMLEVRKRIAMAAGSRSPVLIYGESGTGKELVAKVLHHNGPRASERFVSLDCGALPDSLLELELFGQVGGGSAGTAEAKRGIFEEASGGTVFLSAVERLSTAQQVKLQRTIAKREVRRAGSNRPIPIDVRMIAATNCNLAERVEQGKFREDLYDRLRVIEITLPPLRDRTEDIPLLVEHFLKKLAQARGRAFVVSPPALALLVSHAWPGNVEELESVLEAAAAANRSGELLPEDLPPNVRADFQAAAGLEDLYSGLPSLDELAKRYAAYVLKLTRANKAKSAAILGINRKTLYRMIQKFRLRA
jgi:DNA-binding NtrC family response regulator